MKMLILLSVLSSCALQRSFEAGEPKKLETRQDRILKCVDKYMGEGLKNAYEICRDLYTIE
jgi:hypothetical protein